MAFANGGPRAATIMVKRLAWGVSILLVTAIIAIIKFT